MDTGSTDSGDLYMDVEGPVKSMADYVREWVDYFAGKKGQSPDRESMLIGGLTDEENLELLKKRKAFELERAALDQEKQAILRGEQPPAKKPRFSPKSVEEYSVVLQRVRESIDYIGDDTKLERMMRFRDLLLIPGMDTVRGRVEKRAITRFSQDPYDNGSITWRTRKELALLNIPNLNLMTERNISGSASKEDFVPLYSITGYQELSLETYSAPDIYLLDVKENAVREKFKSILFGESLLLMKITPFIESDGRLKSQIEIDQTYNEIKIAYFLNELLYGYTNVLSVHFMVLVDWFQASRSRLGMPANPQFPTALDEFYSQITISEYAHASANSFLLSNPNSETLKVFLFQVIHALETAWHTNEFVHYDLHLGNIMMKRTRFDETLPLNKRSESSPFEDRNLLYKRRNQTDWYLLKKEHLADHIVKIIDFGFSRLYAPLQERHEFYSLSQTHPPHLHDRFIGLDWPTAAIEPLRPNQYTDLRVLFLSILALPAQYWGAFTQNEREEFYALCRQILDFGVMNSIIDRESFDSEIARIRRYRANGKLTPANIGSCPICIAHLMKFDGYARGFPSQTLNLTPTDALDHSFFDSLRQPAAAHPPASYKKSAQRENIVVSFIDQDSLRETQMLKNAPNSASKLLKQRQNHPNSSLSSKALSCAVCKADTWHVNEEEGGNEEIVPLCCNLCAEFKYVYDSKTVFR